MACKGGKQKHLRWAFCAGVVLGVQQDVSKPKMFKPKETNAPGFLEAEGEHEPQTWQCGLEGGAPVRSLGFHPVKALCMNWLGDFGAARLTSL